MQPGRDRNAAGTRPEGPWAELGCWAGLRRTGMTSLVLVSLYQDPSLGSAVQLLLPEPPRAAMAAVARPVQWMLQLRNRLINKEVHCLSTCRPSPLRFPGSRRCAHTSWHTCAPNKA